MHEALRHVRSARGFALLSLVLFLMVLTVAGMTFMSLASSETRQAIYRQHSTEAFHLADGAVERARAKFMDDSNWWLPPNSPTFSGAAGNGTYDVTVAEFGSGDTISIVANGFVGNAVRRIEVIGEIISSGLRMALFVGGNLNAGGSLCIDGLVHVNGSGDDQHIHCEYEFSNGFTREPPPVYTDPDHYPDATYYYVKADRVTGECSCTNEAHIYDRYGNDITGTNTMTDVITYDAGTNTFVFSFSSSSLISKYFSRVSPEPVFHMDSGDLAVVVNFGEVQLYDPPGWPGPEDVRTSLVFDGSSSSVIHQTIIATRFVGVTENDRLYPSGWCGGHTSVKQVRFEPYYGIALIAYDFGRQGSANARLGSDAWPALVYVTNNAGIPNKITSNLDVRGGFICLGSWRNTGSPAIHYDEGVIENLPVYMHSLWSGGSGSLNVVSWREVAAI